MLNRCRFIGRLAEANERMRFALELYNFPTTMNTQKNRSTNSWALSMKHRRTFHCSPAGPSILSLILGRMVPRVTRVLMMVAQPDDLKALDMRWCHVSDTDDGTWELTHKVHIEIIFNPRYRTDDCLAATSSRSRSASMERSKQEWIHRKTSP